MSKGLSSVKTLSAKEIAKKWDLPLSVVAKKIAAGVKVEKEHTKSTSQANEIARDHLGERPDYYDKLGKMEKQPVVKENTSVAGVAGLGINTGVPAIDDDNSYVSTNALARDFTNGAIMDFINKHHHRLHDKTSFKQYDAKNIKTSSNKDLAESLGSDYGTSAVPVVGDLTGTPRKVTKVDEVKLPTKARKAVATGMTLANLYTAGDVASRAQQGIGSPAKDMVTAASTLSGTKGWAAYGADKARQAYEYVKKNRQLKEDLRKWFKEKWVRYDTKGNIKGPCAREEGEGKPKCQPLASARAMSKEERAKSARRKRREDPVADRSGKGGKPIMVKTNEETLLEKNVPTNPALWARAKAQARSKFDVYPSAYANGWAAKWYKSKGGGWKTAKESVDEACWSSHKQVGMKKKGNRMVPNCVPKEEKNLVPANTVERGIYEATFQGKTVPLGKPMKGDVKKSKVYVDPDGDGKAQKVNFGDPNMTIKKSNPARRKSFRARHNCDNPGPKTKARYWSCRAWEETELFETTLRKKIKYALKAAGQQSRIAKELRPDEVEGDKTYQKRKKGLDRVFKESSQINELDTSSMPFSKNIEDRRPSYNSVQGIKNVADKVVSGVFNGQSIQKSLNKTNASIERQNRDDASALDKTSGTKPKVSNDEVSQKATELMKPKMMNLSSRKTINELSAEVVGRVSNARFWRGEAPSKTLSRAINKKFIESGQKKESTKTNTKEETTMDTKDLINEALDNILEDNLVAMKDNLQTALQEKMMEKLEERKKIIASDYFAQ